MSVGTFDRNRGLAADLGVSLENGIPVAIFFDRDGAAIGTTNAGQLEPARRYSSARILNFLTEVVERERIMNVGFFE